MSTARNFDNLSVALARTTSRRSALKAIGLGVAALAMGRKLTLAADTASYVLDPKANYPVEGGACSAINDYPLGGLTELSSSASHIHMEFWSPSDYPSELEAVLKTANIPGGRFVFTQKALDAGLQGHVWEMGPSCSDSQAKSNTDGQIARRLAGGANNAGWADVNEVASLFTPAVGGNSDIAISGNGSSSTSDVKIKSGNAVDADKPMQGCPASKEQTLSSPTTVTVNGPAIVQPYWNGAPQVRVMLVSGTQATFTDMSGKVNEYTDNTACKHNLPLEFKNGANLASVHLSDLESQGVVTVAKKGDSQDDYKLEAAKA